MNSFESAKRNFGVEDGEDDDKNQNKMFVEHGIENLCEDKENGIGRREISYHGTSSYHI